MKTLKAVFTKPQYTGLFWLVLRVFVGYEFLTAGLEKLGSGQWLFGNGSAIGGFLNGALAKSTGAHPAVQGWYADLVKNVFLPNAAIFQTLVVTGEVLVGLALLLGVFTKFSALMGAIMNFAFLAAGSGSTNPPMVVLEVAMVFAGAGVAYYGIDYFLMPFLAKLFHIGQAETEPVAQGASLPAARPVR